MVQPGFIIYTCSHLGEYLVIADTLMAEEGNSITADGIIVQSNDFSVNESILTGESLAVYKDKDTIDHLIFHGTTVATELAIATITAIGNQTRLGKIGKSLEFIVEEKTPLELQINNFVKKMVIAGAIVFLIVWGINYFHLANILDSLLKALTLAMSILPEEIPVAFTTFMALGAWRLMKMGIVENIMSLAKLYPMQTNHISSAENITGEPEKELIRLALWASEPIPFDPMEIALHEAYSQNLEVDERSNFKMIHEYPLGGKPPMMTHLFENAKGQRIIAAKGAPEALMSISNLSNPEKKVISSTIETPASDGYRILAVGATDFTGNDFPDAQQEFNFTFKGLVAFYDPPKKNISAVLQDFYKAGIAVKIITGDNAETTSAIARQIAFRGDKQCMSGDALIKLSDKPYNPLYPSISLLF